MFASVRARARAQSGQRHELRRASPFTEKYFTQTLDHFNFNSLENGTFSQRYLLTGEQALVKLSPPGSNGWFCPVCSQISSG